MAEKASFVDSPPITDFLSNDNGRKPNLERIMAQTISRVAPCFPARPARREGILVRAIVALLEWQQRARERRHLAQLDDRTLHDIGLSRSDIEAEARKPFWRYY